jgi:hypothetical protein
MNRPARRDDARSGPRRAGRFVAFLLSYGVGVVIAVVVSIQIPRQIFFPARPAGVPVACGEGVRELARAVVRAREAVDPAASEEEAVTRFRQLLAEDFARLPALREACRASESDERALDAIERLRYAEEHALRREASDLAALRREVRALVDEPRAPAPSGAPSR